MLASLLCDWLLEIEINGRWSLVANEEKNNDRIENNSDGNFYDLKNDETIEKDTSFADFEQFKDVPDAVREALKISDSIEEGKKQGNYFETNDDNVANNAFPFEKKYESSFGQEVPSTDSNITSGYEQNETSAENTETEMFSNEMLRNDNISEQPYVDRYQENGEEDIIDEENSENIALEEKSASQEEIPSTDDVKQKPIVVQRIEKGFDVFVSVTWNVIRCMFTGLFRTCKFIIFFFTVLIIASIIGGTVLFGRYHELYTSIRQTEYDRIANLSNETFSNLNNTRIYDDKNKLLAEITSADYDYVEINGVSRYIQEGYIAVEDKNFKEHIGVDPTAILRAANALVKNSGNITQGGSTITQQVVKNTLLTSEQTYVRKCAEILLAIDMEKKFTKAQIMEFYVNSNFYGNQCYGVEAACQYYFGKSAADVNISEAAMIVGMSNSPSKYNPVANYDLAIEKRNNVLFKMLKNGVISQAEYDEAKADKLLVVEKRTETVNETYQVSYAIYCAVITLMEKDGFQFQYVFKNKDDYYDYKERYSEAYSEMSEYVRSGGFDIYTSLNNKQQKQLQKSVSSVLSGFSEKQADGRYAVQGAAVCVDNETGYITAIVGGRSKDDQYNRAYLAKRQPGSTIKPLLDYAPAFDTGEYYPSKVMNDHAIKNGPKNSSGSYRGNISMRDAIARSINTIAYQTLQGIGIKTGMSYLESMRFNSLSYVDNNNLVLSIGGFTNGVRVVDMAKGYSTLATGGNYIERTCIRNIKQQGEGLIFADTKTSHQVFTKDTAWLMTSCLRGTMELSYGTGKGCALNGQISAGKTGTTNDSKDGWFCGYTTRYTTSVWVGRDDNKTIPGMYGATYAGKIWQSYMNTIHEGLEKQSFEKPDTVKKKYIDSMGKPTTSKTNKKDYFSQLAEGKRSLLDQEKEEKAAIKKAEKLLLEYEQFEILKVEDCYLVESKYQTLQVAIAAINDADTRVNYSTRAADRYSDLSKELEKWKTYMAAYEIEQARKEQAEKEKAAKEAEKLAKEREKQNKIVRFNNAIAALREVTDVVTDYTYSLLELASECLSDCTDYPEYDEMLKTYNSEKARIKALAAQNKTDEQNQENQEQTEAMQRQKRKQKDQERLEEEAQE